MFIIIYFLFLYLCLVCEEEIESIFLIIQWENGQTSSGWCVEPYRTFEILETPKRMIDGTYWVIIGNHRKGNGPITRGVIDAIRIL